MSDTDSNEYDSDSVEEEVAPEPTKKRGKAKKDPNKPKRNMSSFFLYSQANRADVKANNPDAAFGDIARLLSAQFKALPEKERAKWDKKAAADKLRYQEEMKHYVPSEEYEDAGGGGGKKKKAKKDPNQPKRNMSAYFLYSVAVRPQVKEQNPDASFGDIAKIISAQFKALPEAERKKWDAKAATDKERYTSQMSDYQATL
jgi:hypothetical protein